MRPGHITTQLRSWTLQPFMPVSAEVYSDIQQFLIYEALLLDHGCLDHWAGLLARDVSYRICNCSGQDRTGLTTAEYIDSSRQSLLRRLLPSEQTASNDETRPPNTRRFVTNVSVSFAHCWNEYDVVSYLRVARIGHSGGTGDCAWSAERRDLLRVTNRSFAISRRELLIDSIEPGSSDLAKFL